MDTGEYCHELFIQGKIELCMKMQRLQNEMLIFCAQTLNFCTMPNLESNFDESIS